MWQNVADGGLSQTKNYHTRWFYASYQKQPSENRKHEVPKLSLFHLIPGTGGVRRKESGVRIGNYWMVQSSP
ncbi:hypothetical protein [Dapis sp. BLCC M172]|uniref:hypothetical protein n=1 Tax=Dapis sp. BLCC M172 TaxID=2975281 RepID=UPI003CE9332F